MVLQPARLPLQLERMIKDRPHRLGLIYVNQPLYFVTFATRDRKRFPSLHRAQPALEQYGHCATAEFNVALGRYVIMPDHVHLFARGDRRFTLSSWIGGLKRAILAALLKEAQPARLPLQKEGDNAFHLAAMIQRWIGFSEDDDVCQRVRDNAFHLGVFSKI